MSYNRLFVPQDVESRVAEAVHLKSLQVVTLRNHSTKSSNAPCFALVERMVPYCGIYGQNTGGLHKQKKV